MQIYQAVVAVLDTSELMLLGTTVNGTSSIHQLQDVHTAIEVTA